MMRSLCRPRTAKRKLVSDALSSRSLRPPSTLTCWQSAALTEPTTVLYDPAAQFVHSVAPMAALAYVPPAHSMHAAALVAAGVALALPASHCDEEVG